MENWSKECPIAITICDKDGVIIDMNEKSRTTFVKNGKELIGENLMDCHPVHAQNVIKTLMENHTVNAYTIEKDGVKKMIYQMPWFENGVFAGLVELSLVLPQEMPHFVRTPSK